LAGRQRNTPIVRFGNVAMNADYIDVENGREQFSFLVECRSLSGFSGSPVFITTTQTYGPENMPKARRPAPPPGQTATVNVGSLWGKFGPWLLGIDSGHIPLLKPLYTPKGEAIYDYRVDANTGIAYVIPAWKIMEVLNDEDLVRKRQEEDG
jgi:hypothetical protein